MLVKIFLFLSLCQGLLFSQTSESQSQPTPTPQKTPVKRKQPSGPINPQNPGGAQEKGAGEINPNDMGGAQANPGSAGGVSDTGAGATSGASAGATSNSSTAGSVSGIAGNASASSSDASATIPAGTQISVTLNRTLSSKTSHKGDLFSATLEESLRASNGEFIIPAGSLVEGEITAVDSSRKSSKLSLRFKSLMLPDAREFPLTASLASIYSEVVGVANNQTSESKVETATEPIGSAAAEAVPTDTSSKKDSYIIATEGKKVELPKGAIMVLRLQQPLVLR